MTSLSNSNFYPLIYKRYIFKSHLYANKSARKIGIGPLVCKFNSITSAIGDFSSLIIQPRHRMRPHVEITWQMLLFTSSPSCWYCDNIQVDLEGWNYYRKFRKDLSFSIEGPIVLEVKSVRI